MQDILALEVREFVTRTAAKEPTPGGGSVAALVGALAAALGNMALEYTVGKKAYAAYEGELRGAMAQLQTAAAMLQELIAEDVAAYAALSEMLKLPQEARLAHPDYAATVVAAIRAPQAAGGFAMNILTLCAGLLEKTNKFLVSDLGIAAVYAHATVHASELNVRVNLPLLPNGEEAAGLKKELYDLTVKADEVYTRFRNDLLRRL
jgi:formiminotetrahydrofolate cyclodeaminase